MRLSFSIDIKGGEFLTKQDLQNIKERGEILLKAQVLSNIEYIVIEVSQLLKAMNYVIVLDENSILNVIPAFSNKQIDRVNVHDIQTLEELRDIRVLLKEELVSSIINGRGKYKSVGVIPLKDKF